MIFYRSVFLSIFLVVAGCGATKQVVPEVTQYDIVSGERAVISLRRDGSFAGSAVSFSVYDGNKFIGDLGINDKLVWARSPGNMSLKIVHSFGATINRLLFTAKGNKYNLLSGFSKPITLVSTEKLAGNSGGHDSRSDNKENTENAAFYKGSDLDLPDKYGNTALIRAAKHGDVETVISLIQKGANLNIQNKYGNTALIRSSYFGHSEIVRVLIEKGANLDIQGQFRNTALIEAATNGHTEIVATLAKNGAQLDLQNEYGHTALIESIREKPHRQIVPLLLNYGADPNIIFDKRGSTAHSLALRLGHNDLALMIRLAIDRHTNPNSESAELEWSRVYQNSLLPEVGNKCVSTEEYWSPEYNKCIPKNKQPPVAANTDKKIESVVAPEKAKTSSLSVTKDKQPPVKQQYASSQRWAVVIGVSDYQDSRVPALRYASKDAESFYDWIVSPDGGRYSPQRVKLLVDDDATNNNIKQALYKWLGQAIEEDQVTIFFAGHGSPNSPDTPENLFLLPYDVNYESIESSGFPMWDIETALHRFIKAKKVTVIADACHSGGIGKPYDVVSRSNRALQINRINSGLQDLSKIGDGVAVISASGDGELSREGEEWGGGHGVFTHFLLEGLEGDADYNSDKDVTLGELIPYLSEKVRRATRSAQSPTVSGRFDPAMSIGR